MNWIDRQDCQHIDGFTLSGGEPFDQAESLRDLVATLRQRYCHQGNCDILVYSGYSWRYLSRRHSEILRQVDLLISGPYSADHQSMDLRGSDNQELHLLSGLAHERYGPDNSNDGRPQAMQVCFDGSALWMIGIPRQGDLARLQDELKSVGIDLESVSWRA